MNYCLSCPSHSPGKCAEQSRGLTSGYFRHGGKIPASEHRDEAVCPRHPTQRPAAEKQ